MRTLIYLPLISLFGAVHAAAAEEGHHHVLPLYPEKVVDWAPISNSMLMVWLSVALIVGFSQIATREMSLVPKGLQNSAEWAVESVYDFLEGLMGAHLVKRTFWFFGSVFFFILLNNWLGLIPGVGTIGWRLGEDGNQGFLPFLRGGNADLNLTVAMSITFAILWFYWAITENGVKGFFSHIFAPKGSFKGLMLILMVLVFAFVGVLEMISIAIRPVALSFRLYGNMYGGEQTLEALMALVPKWLAFLPALPFYFMKLLVGLVQALVFMLLGAIFLKLICEHGDEAAGH